MKKILGICLFAVFTVAGAFAYDVQDAALVTFTAGSPARAADVNQNFDVLQGAINDNDARIIALETAPDDGSFSASTTSAPVLSLADAGNNVLSRTITAPVAGNILVFASGFVSMNDSAAWRGAQFWVSTSAADMSINTTRSRIYIPAGTAGGFELPYSSVGSFPVAAGQTVTVYLKAKRDNAASPVTMWTANLIALFSPN